MQLRREKRGERREEKHSFLWILSVLLIAACGSSVSASGPQPSTAGTLPVLISGDSAAALIVRGGVTVIDVRQPWADYLTNHLPGAEWANVESFRLANGGLPFQALSADGYRDLFQRLAVDPSATVLLYSAGEANDIDATFVAWLLSGMGHPRVRVLDGGYAKWALDNRTLSKTYPRPGPVSQMTGAFHPEAATLDEVKAASAGNGTVLVDARNPQQFAGTAGAQRRRGHIPGAINHPWTGDLETRDLSLVWKPAEALRSAYAAQGITPEKNVIVYCNTGTEASHVWFALRAVLHYSNVRIYTGAWSEWAERDDLPVATGP